jgi:ABC-type nitrate/sulfonate/bicarbonate transport system substrate-binding protein
VRDKRQLSDAFLRGYLEGTAYVQTHRDVTIKVMGKYTRQRDPEVLEKYYEELIGSLPRIPYIEEASLRATVEAMQNQGPPLPKVEPKTLFDNSLLKGLETEGFIDKIKAR